jgi:hypothetical protein
VFLLSGCHLLAELLLPDQGGGAPRGRPCRHRRHRRRPATAAISRGALGIGCCKAPIPVGGCDSYDVTVKGTRSSYPYNSARAVSNFSVLIAEDGWFDQRNLTASMALPQAEKTRVPVVLAWAVVGSDAALQGPSDQTRDGNATCPQDIGCHSSFSSCTRVTHPYCDHASGYHTCKCWQGYQGNPYLHNGCQGN